jgi:CheY-like chemotaxis protein
VRQGRRALVVDDEPDLAETLAEMLEDEGFAVDLALSGAAAIERLETEGYDLILSDLSMPGVDGPALRVWIAAYRPALLPALAFLTGEATGAGARALIGEGHPFLLKPFTPKELRDLLLRVPGSPP